MQRSRQSGVDHSVSTCTLLTLQTLQTPHVYRIDGLY